MENDFISREQALYAVSGVMADVLISGFAGKKVSFSELAGMLKESLLNLQAIAAAGNEKSTDELLEYIIGKMHWCPFEDEAGIDFEKECAGFGGDGCRGCILRHLDKLNC